MGHRHAPDQPDVHIVLETPQAWPDASPADREAVSELLVKGLVSRLIVTTDDVDALHDRLSAAGAEVLQEPVDQQYGVRDSGVRDSGVRDSGVRDPSGNQLRSNQPLASVPAWS